MTAPAHWTVRRDGPLDWVAVTPEGRVAGRFQTRCQARRATEDGAARTAGDHDGGPCR